MANSSVVDKDREMELNKVYFGGPRPESQSPRTKQLIEDLADEVHKNHSGPRSECKEEICIRANQ